MLLLVLMFALSLALPGDAADVRRGDLVSDAQQAETRRLLGLDLAPMTRFLHWLGRALTGDLGVSYISGRPVTEVVTGPFLVSGAVALLATLVLVPWPAPRGSSAGCDPVRPGTARSPP